MTTDDRMVITGLDDWFGPPDPRESHRPEVGEAQRERVKRRRRKPKRVRPDLEPKKER